MARVLTEEQSRRVGRVVRRVERMPLATKRRKPRAPKLNTKTAFVGKATEEIPAMVGAHPGKGEVEIYDLDENEDLIATGITLDAYSMSLSVIADGKWIQCKYRRGKPYLDFEQCPA